jgi:translation elongation factor EF-Tu-like GTPase
MEAVDKSIPTPQRPLDEPFMMPIEHVHQIPGRSASTKPDPNFINTL